MSLPRDDNESEDRASNARTAEVNSDLDGSQADGVSQADDDGDLPVRRRHFDEEDSGDDDDEVDEDDDEDDEDDEEDEDDGGNDGEGGDAATHEPGQQRKRKKRRAGNRFLDVEAEVDEDEEDFEEEDEELAREDGFIEQEALDEGDETRRRYAVDNQRLDRLRREQEDKSAEQLAEELNERYRRTTRYAAQSDYAEVPQRLLMPSVDDPKLWCVKCKIGRERDIVMTLLRKQDVMGGALRFISAFCRDSLPGRLYVESKSAADVLYAVQDVVGCYARGESQLQMVPIGEMADLLKITKLQPTVKIGGWVRVKRGKYAGDLAQVIDQAENGEDVGIKFVPRIDMNPRDTNDTFIDKNGRKRKKNAMRGFADRGSRPQQRFFNPDEVRKVYAGSDRPVKRGDREWVFQKDTFRDGYCERDVRIDHLLLKDVKPSLDEITKFTGASIKEGGDAATAAAATANGEATAPVDLEMLANAAKETSTTTLERDDAVEVFEGDLTGVQGTVQKISGNIITILFDDKKMLDQTAEVPARSVRKRFKPGDHVKVTTGKHQDETGLVVKTEDNFTTFLSDLTLSEVTVFSRDLRQATEVGSGVNDIAGYELHNLVQLDAQTAGVIFKIERESFKVLDQLGNVLNVRPHQISMKRDTGRAVALDNEGSEFRAGDKMKEVEGEHREGQVLHIYQSVMVFMHNRDVADNGGVFISRARQLIPVAPKSTAFGNAGAGMKSADLSKQNPQLTAGLANAAQVGGGGGAASSMRRMGRDPLQGRAVSIIKGPYKTYRGIIKDTNGPIARVELHTMAKILTIELKFLVEKDPMTGKSRPLLGNGPVGGAGSMGPPGGIGGGNPYAQTPRAGSNPYTTPNMGMGGATPYGNTTPGYGAYGAGSKTPAYGGAGSGGKTPAYLGFEGSKTPAYGSFGGGKTPNPYASIDGSKTPSYGAYGSGKTPNPYASMDGSKTPYAGDSGAAFGGATPGWRPDASSSSNGSDPRRRYGDNPYASSSTPYGAAPTPGAAYGASTPGGYGIAPTSANGGYSAAATSGTTPGSWGAPPGVGAFLSAPTPGVPLSGPTPSAYAAPIPWGGPAASAAAHYGGSMEGVDKPLAETLVRIVKDSGSGLSYQGGQYDGTTGAVIYTSPDGESASVQLDGGELLRDVPARFINPQRPDRTGELCLVTMGSQRGRSAKVASVDANEFMVTLDDKSMHVLPPGALAKKA